MNIDVHPVTPQDWTDLASVFGTRGDASWCFCQFFVDPQWNRGRDANRAALRSQIETSEIPIGLIAYAEGAPVGWVQVGPRTRYPRLDKKHTATASQWYLTCFVVPPQHRRRGVSTALLRAAIDHARDHGADILEARPTDTNAATATKKAASDLFTGVLSMFLEAGFVEISRNRSRVLVHLDLHP